MDDRFFLFISWQFDHFDRNNEKQLTVNIQIPEIFSVEYVFSNVYKFWDVILFSELPTSTYKYQQKKFKMQSIKMQLLMQVLHPDLSNRKMSLLVIYEIKCQNKSVKFNRQFKCHIFILFWFNFTFESFSTPRPLQFHLPLFSSPLFFSDTIQFQEVSNNSLAKFGSAATQLEVFFRLTTF